MSPTGCPVWIDGTLVGGEETCISPYDRGFTMGDGVYETLRVYHGVPFALRRHLDRLERSAARIGVPVPARATLERAAAEVVGASGLASCRLRITVTAGPATPGPAQGGSEPTVVAVVGALAPASPTADVVVVPWVRNERGILVGVKSTSYGENVVALARAHAAGADEAVVGNTRGELCEGTGTNVFVASGGRLLTPPRSAGCLGGVTRELVLELTGATEHPLPLAALAEADEAFLTSSTREVQPIASVNGTTLPAAPGPLTTAAVAAFGALLGRDLDP